MEAMKAAFEIVNSEDTLADLVPRFGLTMIDGTSDLEGLAGEGST